MSPFRGCTRVRRSSYSGRRGSRRPTTCRRRRRDRSIEGRRCGRRSRRRARRSGTRRSSIPLPPGSTSDEVHAAAPPPGSVDVRMRPASSLATQSELDGHDCGNRLTGLIPPRSRSGLDQLALDAGLAVGVVGVVHRAAAGAVDADHVVRAALRARERSSEAGRIRLPRRLLRPAGAAVSRDVDFVARFAVAQAKRVRSRQAGIREAGDRRQQGVWRRKQGPRRAYAVSRVGRRSDLTIAAAVDSGCEAERCCGARQAVQHVETGRGWRRGPCRCRILRGVHVPEIGAGKTQRR
jgi:hypothetical protein